MNVKACAAWLLLAGLFCLIPTGKAVHAEIVLLFDTFDIPIGSATRLDDAADPNDTDWFRANGSGGTLPGLSVVGGELLVDITTASQPFVGSFSTVSLTNVGNSIRFSGKIRQPVGAGGGFFFGLYDDAGTPTTADNDTSSEDDTGYIFALGTPTGASIGASSIRKDIVGTGEVIGGGGVIGSAESTGIDDDSLFHDFFLNITRTTATSLTLDVGWSGSTNGITSFTRTDSSGVITSFNSVAISFGLGTGAADFDYVLDDLKVTTIPEPSSVWLVAIGLMATLSRRRN